MLLDIAKQGLTYTNEYGTAIIAICTAAYLFVTWRLLNENIKAYDAKYMPIICIEYDKSDKKFKVNNIGQGLAIAIEVSSFQIFITDADMEFRLDFKKVFNLKPNEKKDLTYVEKVNEEKIDGGFLAVHLYSEFGKGDHSFTLIVRDIIGNIYYEKINMGVSGIFIVNHKKTWWASRLCISMIDRIAMLKFIIFNKNRKRTNG